MKRMDMFCASQAATAIRFSMDEGSSSSSSSSNIQLGSSRAIDRHNPIITDPRRIGRTLPYCSSQPAPISPKQQNHQIKYQNLSSKTVVNEPKKKQKKKKKSTANAKPSDEKRKSTATTVDTNEKTKSWSCTKPSDFISPPGSSRYLLRDEAFLNVRSDFDPVLKVVPVEPSKSNEILRKDDSCASKSSSSSSPSSEQLQVVVLRVSLHCRGCERKMRKHISRMEGVSSFNIDFAAKKVTVVGNVTPVGVLASISKVKNAQLWNPAAAPSSVTTVNRSAAEMKKLDVPPIS